MEEDFQIGPYFLQRFFAGLFKNTLDEYQHPRRNAGEAGYILRNSTVGNGFYFLFKVAHESDLLAWNANTVY